MLHFRRFIWYIARLMIVICVLAGMLVCGFFMAMNISNIYVVLNDGLEKRVDVILTRQQAEELNKYFSPEFLLADPALDGALTGTSAYVDYNITSFEHDLNIEKLWAWPWDDYANCTVVERVPYSDADASAYEEDAGFGAPAPAPAPQPAPAPRPAPQPAPAPKPAPKPAPPDTPPADDAPVLTEEFANIAAMLEDAFGGSVVVKPDEPDAPSASDGEGTD